jgi:hypothetical protein
VLLICSHENADHALLAAALTATACRANKKSYTSRAGVPTPSELMSNTIVRVPIAARNLYPGVILRASDRIIALLTSESAELTLGLR